MCVCMYLFIWYRFFLLFPTVNHLSINWLRDCSNCRIDGDLNARSPFGETTRNQNQRNRNEWEYIIPLKFIPVKLLGFRTVGLNCYQKLVLIARDNELIDNYRQFILKNSRRLRVKPIEWINARFAKDSNTILGINHFKSSNSKPKSWNMRN